MKCLCYFRIEKCIVTPTPSYLYTNPYFFTLNRTTQSIRDRSIPTPKLSVLNFLPLTEPLSQSETGVSQLPNFLSHIFYSLTGSLSYSQTGVSQLPYTF